MFVSKCEICHTNVEYRRKGFPKRWCENCKAKGLKKYHAEWHQNNKIRRKLNRKKIPVIKKIFECKNCSLNFRSYRPNVKWCPECRRVIHNNGVKEWRKRNPIKYRMICRKWMAENKKRIKGYKRYNRPDNKRERSKSKIFLETLTLISDVRKEILSLGE